MDPSVEDTVQAHILIAGLAPCEKARAQARAAALVTLHHACDNAPAIEGLARELEDSCSGYEPMALDLLAVAAAVRMIGEAARGRRF